MYYATEDCGFDSVYEKVLLHNELPVFGPTKPPTHLVTGAIALGGKQPDVEA
jgi:hypothetical protein